MEAQRSNQDSFSDRVNTLLREDPKDLNSKDRVILSILAEVSDQGENSGISYIDIGSRARKQEVIVTDLPTNIVFQRKIRAYGFQVIKSKSNKFRLGTVVPTAPAPSPAPAPTSDAKDTQTRVVTLLDAALERKEGKICKIIKENAGEFGGVGTLEYRLAFLIAQITDVDDKKHILIREMGQQLGVESDVIVPVLNRVQMISANLGLILTHIEVYRSPTSRMKVPAYRFEVGAKKSAPLPPAKKTADEPIEQETQLFDASDVLKRVVARLKKMHPTLLEKAFAEAGTKRAELIRIIEQTNRSLPMLIVEDPFVLPKPVVSEKSMYLRIVAKSDLFGGSGSLDFTIARILIDEYMQNSDSWLTSPEIRERLRASELDVDPSTIMDALARIRMPLQNLSIDLERKKPKPPDILAVYRVEPQTNINQRDLAQAKMDIDRVPHLAAKIQRLLSELAAIRAGAMVKNTANGEDKLKPRRGAVPVASPKTIFEPTPLADIAALGPTTEGGGFDLVNGAGALAEEDVDAMNASASSERGRSSSPLAIQEAVVLKVSDSILSSREIAFDDPELHQLGLAGSENPEGSQLPFFNKGFPVLRQEVAGGGVRYTQPKFLASRHIEEPDA